MAVTDSLVVLGPFNSMAGDAVAGLLNIAANSVLDFTVSLAGNAVFGTTLTGTGGCCGVGVSSNVLPKFGAIVTALTG